MLLIYGHATKAELTDGSTIVSSETLEKLTNIGQNMQCAYSDVQEILNFKTFKGFKKQLAHIMANI
jgi:hypothetical protein